MKGVRMKYGLDMTFEELQSDPDALAVFQKVLPGLLEKLGANPMTAKLSLRKVAGYMQGKIPAAALEKLDELLQQLGEQKGGISPEEMIRVEQYKKMEADRLLRAKEKKQIPEVKDRTAVHPGQVWTDTQGERIQAHGGALLYENGKYYWYGENKEFTTGTSKIWQWGVRLYESEDLYNWTDLGVIIPPVVDNPNSILFPERQMTRPHILQSKTTGKYVCWMVIAGQDSCFCVLEADALCGPYTMVKEFYRPFDYHYADFDMVFSKKDGTPWFFVDVDHSSIYGFRMSEDLLSLEEEVSVSYKDMHAPFCREGIALFERKDLIYMLTSGTTGYLPNPSDSATTTDWRTAFASAGDPYVDDVTRSSFNSQFTQVFALPGKEDAYIALSDRWVPSYPIDAAKSDMIMRVVASHYEPEKYQATEEERVLFSKAPHLHEANTSEADYVWLPVKFEDGRVRIAWKDAWTLEDC